MLAVGLCTALSQIMHTLHPEQKHGDKSIFRQSLMSDKTWGRTYLIYIYRDSAQRNYTVWLTQARPTMF